MIDPFECRIQFKDLLKKINANQHSISRAVSYAMKYSEFHETLYNCIIDSMEDGSLNRRLNLLYFIEALSLRSAQSRRKLPKNDSFAAEPNTWKAYYSTSIEQDLEKLVQLGAPKSFAGLINLAAVKSLVESWYRKSIFDREVLRRILKDLEEQYHQHYDRDDEDKLNMNKDDALARMEQDRERHKRVKEVAWYRDPSHSGADEFLEIWNSVV